MSTLFETGSAMIHLLSHGIQDCSYCRCLITSKSHSMTMKKLVGLQSETPWPKELKEIFTSC